MTKFTLVNSRMPRADHSIKEDKQRRKKRGGKGGKDNDSDSDTSVDSKGNLRDLIDYGSEDEEDDTPYWMPVPSYMVIPPRSLQQVRPMRKAALIARQRIQKLAKDHKERKEKRNTIHYPPVTQKSSSKLKSKTTTIQPLLIPASYYPIPYPVTSTSHRKGPIPPPPSVEINEENEMGSHDMYEEDEDQDYDEDEDEDEDDKDEDDEEEDDKDEDDEEEDDEDDEEDEDEEEDDKDEDDEEEDEEDEEEDEDEDEDEEEDEEEDEDEDEGDETPPLMKKPSQGKSATMGDILFTLMSGPSGEGKLMPKKYKLKKEPEIVQRFVRLLSEPEEANPIDTQIDQFKSMSTEKQNELVSALENRPVRSDTGIQLMLRILTMKVSSEIRSMIFSRYHSLQSMDSSTNEYYKLRAWLEKVVSVPFGIYKELPVRLEDGPDRCGEFMTGARRCLDQATYGQEDPKLQIMQFISTKIANPSGKGLSLLLVGPPGIGKTTIIKNGIAKALGWPFQFISLGGDSDASTYTGHQLVYESSHCGKIVNSLVSSKSMSTVMMFDEVDKISQTAKGEEIMNLLIHLTDPVQNSEFEDKYLAGIPIDLSKVMFVFSANDIQKIDRVLLDRMIVIDLKGYDLKEKTVIAEQYLVPDALREVNLTEKVSLSKEILTTIIQEYANEEKGVRELKRCIDQIAQKINMLRMYNSPQLPFHIPHFSLPFIVKKEHIRLFLKKKGEVDAPPFGMYL